MEKGLGRLRSLGPEESMGNLDIAAAIFLPFAFIFLVVVWYTYVELPRKDAELARKQEEVKREFEDQDLEREFFED